MIPVLGGLVSGRWSAYQYLPASVQAFPEGNLLVRLLADSGFRDARTLRAGMGTIAIHVAEADPMADGRHDPSR